MKNFIFTPIMLLVLSASVLQAQNRVAIIEQFTNSGCPPCAAATPPVINFVNNTADVVCIAYHTSFPYSDSMYFENPVESNARVGFYGVAGVPYSILDGNVFTGVSSSFNTNIATTVGNRLSVAPKYTIENLSLNVVGNQLTGSLKFTSINGLNVSDNLIAQIVVIEKNVLKSSYAGSPGANTENEYGYVMRKMLPNASGTVLLNKAINESDTVNFAWTLNHIKNVNELRVVAFIQNNATKEMYQSAIFTPQLNPSGINNTNKKLNEISVYPNPLIDELTIQFKDKLYINSYSIVNQLGAIVFKENINETTQLVRTFIDIPAGIYFLNVVADNETIVQKISIIK